MFTKIIALLLVMLMVGCIPENKKEEAGEKSTARQAVEGFTGKTAVDNYQRTKVKIKDADASQKDKTKDIEEIAK